MSYSIIPVTGRWRAAYNRILLAVLEDVRVFRVAKSVLGASPPGVHLIEVSLPDSSCCVIALHNLGRRRAAR